MLALGSVMSQNDGKVKSELLVRLKSCFCGSDDRGGSSDAGGDPDVVMQV